jgi:hypothetical protein
MGCEGVSYFIKLYNYGEAARWLLDIPQIQVDMFNIVFASELFFPRCWFIIPMRNENTENTEI